jgi:Glyoxalase-like domain
LEVVASELCKLNRVREELSAGDHRLLRQVAPRRMFAAWTRLRIRPNMAFQSAFVVTVVVAAVGVLVAAVAFPRERKARLPAPAVAVDAQFDGLVISSERPQELRAWYAAAFDGEMDLDGESPRPLALGGVQLFFLPHPDVVGPAREPKRILINFRVNDAREHAARLVGLGATWIRPVEPQPFGLLGTVADPDGNYVQIAQITGASGRIDEDETPKEASAASR